MHCGELQVQSCHSYCSRGSEHVAKLHAGDVFLYAFRKTCMQCLVSLSVVSACGCNFWSLMSRDSAQEMFFYMRLEKNVCSAIFSQSFVSTWDCKFWTLNNINSFVRHMLLFTVRIRELLYIVRMRISSILEDKSVYCYSAAAARWWRRL